MQAHNPATLAATWLQTEGRVVGLCWEHLKPKGPKVVEDNDATHSSTLQPASLTCVTNPAHPTPAPNTTSFVQSLIQSLITALNTRFHSRPKSAVS